MQAGQVGLERIDGATVVSLLGEHDLTTAPKLRDAVDDALQNSGAVVFDLGGTEFIDSSILGVLIDARRRAEEAGRRFELVMADAGPAVARVLDVTGLAGSLNVRSSLEEALSATADDRTAAE